MKNKTPAKQRGLRISADLDKQIDTEIAGYRRAGLKVTRTAIIQQALSLYFQARRTRKGVKS